MKEFYRWLKSEMMNDFMLFLCVMLFGLYLLFSFLFVAVFVGVSWGAPWGFAFVAAFFGLYVYYKWRNRNGR
jgi:hypothetical protein